MANNSERPRLIRRFLGIPGRTLRGLGYLYRRAVVGLRNGLRRLRRTQVEYVVLRVAGPLPEREGPPRPFFQRFLPLPLPPTPLSMETLNGRLRRIADAPNVRGVVFIFGGLATGLATLQNLRRSLERLRAAGKEVIVFTPYLDLAHYYVASAADCIVAPPSASFDVLGLRSEAIFLKDALNEVGVEMDVFQISPYKASGNIFSRSDMPEEQREQLGWLLDDNYEQLTEEMAAGRNMEPEALRTLIDQAPFPVTQAQTAGLVDDVGYEDDLARLLAGEDQEKATLWRWPQARRLLLEQVYRPVRKFIGVISLEGTIVPGSSRQSPIDLPLPLVSGTMAGDETLRRLLRRAERMPDMAALILHVDSPGGVALSADLIWRDVQRLAKKKPVLVYMGNVAASGGYYVSAPAGHIMAQSLTLTGSIGVWSGRVNTDGLYEKLHVHRVTLARGEHANLYGDSGELSEEEQRIMWKNMVHTYEQFKQVVAAGRNLPLEELDPICEGRVWTGRQARERGLVDSHGDFVEAIERAAEMAELQVAGDEIVPVYNFYAGRDGYLLPRPFPASPESWLLSAGRWLETISGRPLLLMPCQLRWRW